MAHLPSTTLDNRHPHAPRCPGATTSDASPVSPSNTMSLNWRSADAQPSQMPAVDSRPPQ
eukprot:6654722-Lingulodinium_polyedra.AAC.1